MSNNFRKNAALMHRSRWGREFISSNDRKYASDPLGKHNYPPPPGKKNLDQRMTYILVQSIVKFLYRKQGKTYMYILVYIG